MTTGERLAASAVVLGLCLASTPAAGGEDPLGLGYLDLKAIRHVQRENPKWLQALSEDVRKLLLDVDDVAQVIVQEEGGCVYRGRSDRLLSRRAKAKPADYTRLRQALEEKCFKDAFAKAQAPLGLSQTELLALRQVMVDNDWPRPPLSRTLRSLIVDRTEVVQIAIHLDGTCLLRSHSQRSLEERKEGDANDYGNLSLALDSQVFRGTLEFVKGAAGPLTGESIRTIATRVAELGAQCDRLELPPRAKDRLKYQLGLAVLRLPAETRKGLSGNAQWTPALSSLVDGVRKQEDLKLAAVRSGKLEHATERDADALAGYLRDVRGVAGVRTVLPLRPVGDGGHLRVLEIEPGSRVIIKADKDTAEALGKGLDPAALAKVLAEKKPEIAIDRGGSDAPTRIKPEDLARRIQGSK